MLMKKTFNRKNISILLVMTVVALQVMLCATVAFADTENVSSDGSQLTGGAYAATGQVQGVGYSTKLYDATNGLVSSDAMCLYSTSDGRIWIGGYSGILVYDGNSFEQMDASQGYTSGRAIFEDSKGRVWVGTNDNGVVVKDCNEVKHLTYKEGLPSSSIRSFAEDSEGNIVIGTTAGVCYVSSDMGIHAIADPAIDKERILQVCSDSTGKIYGVTGEGVIFDIQDKKIQSITDGEALGIGKITTILIDPTTNGNLFIGTEEGKIYKGAYGAGAEQLQLIETGIGSIHWLNYSANRLWVCDTSSIGYVDDNNTFNIINNLPINSGLEMMVSDYQGNMWFASSTQGVMKIATNNFIDLMEKYRLPNDVVNTTCLYNGILYIGMDEGILAVDGSGNTVNNEITQYVDKSRVRCIKEDREGNLWIATYTDDKGLLRVGNDGVITAFNKENGMPNNKVRTIVQATDGSMLIGSNGGLTIIKDGAIVKNVGENQGVKNTVFLTVEEGLDGKIYAGSDGDGIYIIDGDNISKINRDDGLTSDVILRIKKDEQRGVLWLATSNSIQYIKDGKVNSVSTFPYNDNYDLYFDKSGGIWTLASSGIYNIAADDMINDTVVSYNHYSLDDGLPYGITSNSFSAMDGEGNLYICGRQGVIKVNINNFYEQTGKILTGIKSITCDEEKIEPNSDGSYTIPSSDGRINIAVSVMDYSMRDPLVHVYLENGPDEGVTAFSSKLTGLEYTDMPYGNYNLHIEILDNATKSIISDDVYSVEKEARLGEIAIIQVLLVIIIAGLVGFGVWWIIRNTTIRGQYEEIRKAKEEAERANSAKSKFLANMSHEIRTPINTIMGMNEMTLREDASNVPKSYYRAVLSNSHNIGNASETLISLINDLLDMSKIESGKMHLVEQEYDMRDMLRSSLAMVRQRTIDKGLTYDVIVDEKLPCTMYGDIAKIKQILVNLLTNAVKYTEIGGFALCVAVVGRNEDNIDLRISVKDTGIGVKEEEIDKLFTAYERLDEVKNSEIQGTGLGLDISKRLAHLLNGELTCESVYGNGSEFILTVTQKVVDEKPIGIFVEKDESEQRGYVPLFIAPDADILVVDDNPMNLNVIKGLLQATKVFVTTATSGEEAIYKVKDSHFDVVLLDHMMPGLDGVETLERIRKFAPDIPVYALTANATLGEDFYLSKGFNGYLTKPVDTDTLEKTIMKHLDEAKMIKADKDIEVDEVTTMPDNKMWLYDVEGLNVDEGIKNSGGVTNYIFSLKMFLDMIDENTEVISKSYVENNIRMYTIKVHALKSNARIIGAEKLSELAEKLEIAGNEHDKKFIDDNNQKLLVEYVAYKHRLSRLKEESEADNNDDSKEMIPEDVLKDAYEALKDMIPQMDIDAVEMILDDLKDYRLPKEDEKKMDSLRKCLKNVDWEGMEELIGQ
ncbi:MAG: response regulator [Lachnospiraceae bacterium]|nr:response regulator [Lachnospiraceae bacterium]